MCKCTEGCTKAKVMECVKEVGQMDDFDAPKQIQNYLRLGVYMRRPCKVEFGQLRHRDDNNLQETLR